MNKVCKDVMKYLRAEYKRKGHNFYFSAKNINLVSYSNHLKGSALGKLCILEPIDIETNRKSHPKLYKTRFPK